MNSPRHHLDETAAGPGRRGQLIRLHPQTRQRHLDWLTWGLAPPRDSDSAVRPIHARAETVTRSPLFADAFRRRRGIAPAVEYFQRGAAGRRFAIARADGEPMAIAALWNAHRLSTGEVERTYCIITVPASGAVAEIHERMPLVLEPRDWALWLGEEAGNPATLLHPPAADILVVRPRDG